MESHSHIFSFLVQIQCAMQTLIFYDDEERVENYMADTMPVVWCAALASPNVCCLLLKPVVFCSHEIKVLVLVYCAMLPIV